MSGGQVIAAVAAVLLAAAAIAARRRHKLGGERFLIALVVAVGLGVYASGLLSSLPDAKKIIEDLAEALGQGTYALVAVMAFLETGAFVGLIAPGEFTVIIGGVIAGQGEINVVPLLGLVWLSCVLGDTVSFFIGRRLGRQFLERHGPKVKITHERLAQVDEYFDKHGGKTILIGRFIGIIRALAPFVAGASGLTYGRFIPYSVIGTGLWGSFYTLLGYFFYRSFDKVAGIAGRATFVFAALVATIAAIVWATRKLRDPEQRARVEEWLERQAERPLLRPLARVLRPLWKRALAPTYRIAAPRIRFLLKRLTPGDLGLELTTALAIAGVGIYVFTAYTVYIVPRLGPTGLDGRVVDIVGDLRTDTLIDIAKVVTVFGSFPATASLIAIGALLLAIRRRPVELVVLVLGALAIYAIVQITKGAVDRPRPPAPLTGSSGAAFPSGHAAYSTCYVAMAIIAARILPNLASRVGIVIASVVAAAAIGSSRAYLSVHWWSDVLSGWALGAAVFGLLGAVGVVVDFLMRHNHDGEPAPAAAAGGAASDRA